MKTIEHKNLGTCSRSVTVQIDDNDIIVDASFLGGCSGNTQGVCALVKGMSVTEAISRLSGIRCGFKSTSCPDQLAEALKGYLAEKNS